MPHGYSLHVGLNSVDPIHYQGWDGQLRACEFDAKDMQALLKANGFDTSLLLTKQATADVVLNKLKHIASIMKAGDTFIFTNSSHGGQVPDVSNDEADGMDETICMFDREIIDDELGFIWALFPAGSRVGFFSDSCHSGTNARDRREDVHMAHAYSRAMPIDAL